MVFSNKLKYAYLLPIVFEILIYHEFVLPDVRQLLQHSLQQLQSSVSLLENVFLFSVDDLPTSTGGPRCLPFTFALVALNETEMRHSEYIRPRTWLGQQTMTYCLPSFHQ